MKKYFVIIISTVLLAILIQTVYHKETIETKWVESCYGITCEDFTVEPLPRNDWGGNYVGAIPYCDYYYWKQVENIPELHELIQPDCYV